MKLRDHIQVNASCSAVWEVLSDPNLMELWNPKCVQSDAGQGPFGVGFPYSATFKLGSNPERTADCLIEEYRPDELLTTRYSGGAFQAGGYVRETYRLTPKRHGTRIDQTLDFTHSEIPFIAQLVMKIISSVGRKVGEGPLDGIKELAEQEEGRQAG